MLNANKNSLNVNLIKYHQEYRCKKISLNYEAQTGCSCKSFYSKIFEGFWISVELFYLFRNFSNHFIIPEITNIDKFKMWNSNCLQFTILKQNTLNVNFPYNNMPSTSASGKLMKVITCDCKNCEKLLNQRLCSRSMRARAQETETWSG